jgi:hypothetical protein
MSRSGRTERSVTYPMECVLGAITCSVSFLECCINGLYHYAAGRRTEPHKALSAVWREGGDRQPTLAKYQIALGLAGTRVFSAGSDPYQSVALLIALRNGIAHPKELIGTTEQDKLEKSFTRSIQIRE